jgi:hypothetical protein
MHELRLGPAPWFGNDAAGRHLPEFNAHWSKLSIARIAPRVKTLCSYSATMAPSVAGSSLSARIMLVGRLPSVTRNGMDNGDMNRDRAWQLSEASFGGEGPHGNLLNVKPPPPRPVPQHLAKRR